MGEPIKPDLILHLKRPWFVKVWNGEKTVEYREVKPYWAKRIQKLDQRFFVEFRLTMKNGPRILAQVNKVDVGSCPYKGWTGTYYRLHFDVVQTSLFQDGTYIPFVGKPPRMKEQKGNKA